MPKRKIEEEKNELVEEFFRQNDPQCYRVDEYNFYSFNPFTSKEVA